MIGLEQWRASIGLYHSCSYRQLACIPGKRQQPSMTAEQLLSAHEHDSQGNSTCSHIPATQTPSIAFGTAIETFNINSISHFQIPCSHNTDDNNLKVYTTLFIMIALALWLVWTCGNEMLLINGYSLIMRGLTCIIALKKSTTATSLLVCVCALIITAMEGNCGDLQRCLAAMAILLIMAGDVEQNPGPIGELDISRYLCRLSQNDLEALGLALGLYQNTISGYRNMIVQDQFCRYLIHDWINEKDNVTKCGGASWSSLVNALRSETLRQYGIAATIEAEQMKDDQTDEMDIHTISSYIFRLSWGDLNLLGLTLGLDQRTLDSYENGGQFCRRLIRDWINMKDNVIGCGGATWSSLVKALRSETVSQNGIATQIEAEQSLMEDDQQQQADGVMEIPNRHRYISDAVAQFAAHLHKIYQNRTLPVNKRQPTPGKHYINLAVISKEDIKKEEIDEFTLLRVHGKVDDIIKKKKPIKLQQIGRLEDGSFARCILVEGAPGVGKTTLAWELCRRWKEILAEFDVVLLLTLRNRSIQEAKTLSELFYHPNEEIQKKISHEITDVNGPSVLLILEGYDEMPEHIQRDSIFSNIIEGVVLPQASVLITTRPSSGRIVHIKCLHQNFQHVEVVGFTSKDINRYIHDELGQDQTLMEKFCGYLDRHPQIRTMMSNPLNCGLTIKCYQHYEDSDVALITQTELYSNVIKMIIVGELSSNGNPLNEQRIRTLSDFPKDIYHELLDLCQFAYDNIVENVLVFQELPQNTDLLGLVQKSEDSSYNFVHLTLQEFLAAYHISLLPPIRQAECIDTHIHQDHMQLVLCFLAGLTKFVVDHGNLWDFFQGLFRDRPKELLRNYIQSPEARFFLESVHWLFEIQDKDFIQSTVGQKTHKHNLSGHTLSPFDCYALGYCIENSTCQWKLELKSSGISNETAEALCHSSLQNVEMLDLSRNKANEIGSFLASSLQDNHVLTELRLEGCGMNEEVTAELTGVLQYTTSLKVLDLSLNNIGTKAATNIGRCCSTVSHLYLVGCSIGDKQISEMAQGLRYGVALSELWLKANPIGEQGAAVLAEAIESNKTLEILSLLGCGSIGNKGATSLVQSFLSNCSLKRLQLPEAFRTACRKVQDYNRVANLLDWCADFTQQSVVKIENKNIDHEVLAHVLRGNTALTELILVNCCRSIIVGSDIHHLRVALKDIHTLAVLDLSKNSIGSSGTNELALLLKEHDRLTELSLKSCGIGHSEVSNLRQCLKNITRLNLGYNVIKNKGAEQLAQSLKENTTLSYLNLYDCGISADGMLELSQSLINKPLQFLRLGKNKFASEGAQYLAKALAENTTLSYLELFCCEIGTDGMADLSSSFQNKPLQHLDLVGNKFGSKGVEYLANALERNTTLTKLWLRGCGVEDKSMAHLRKKLGNTTNIDFGNWWM